MPEFSKLQINSTVYDVKDTTARSGVASNAANISANASDIATQAARIDQFTHLPDGSTSGDAELMDIRVGADGVTYTSAGAAVRANDSLLKSHLEVGLDDLSDVGIEGYTKDAVPVSGTVQDGIINENGVINTSITSWKVLEINAVPGRTYNIVSGTGDPLAIAKDANGNIVGKLKIGNNTQAVNVPYTAPIGTAKLYINRSSYATPVVEKKYTGDYKMGDDLLIASRIKTLAIEGYEKKITELTGTVHSNSMVNGTGGYVTVNGWTALEVEVIEETVYYITGTGNPGFIVQDAQNNVLDHYNPGVVSFTDYKYTTPRNAVKLVVNRNRQVPVVKTEADFEFIHKAEDVAELGYEITEGEYLVGKKFINGIGLNTSNNGMFNFDHLLLNGTDFKGVKDDISPILLVDAGYVGANHGYNFAYNCTSAGHGLTASDIGKTYSDGTNTWVLIKVISEDVFQMVCYDGTKWYKAKTATVPGSVNFGSSVTISASSLTQIYPSIKNGSVHVAENSPTVFRVIESYDVIDLGTALDALISNVGSNTNDSLVTLADAVMTLNTVYEFNESGTVTIYQRLTKHKAILLSAFYGSQCMAFATSDLIAVLGTTFPTLQSTIESAAKENWADSSVAPSVFIKSDSTKEKLFVIAYVLDRTSNIKTSAGAVYPASKKLYPNMVQPYSDDISAYQNIVLRMPISKNASGADYTAYANVGSDVYVFIGTLTAKTADVMVNGSIYGKQIEVVASNNLTVNTQTVTSSINITSTGEGYALLKVS